MIAGTKLPPIVHGGEIVGDKEIAKALDAFEHDCKEFAGQFYDMERSEKFRLDWPDQDRFVESEWRAFVNATRFVYTEALGSPSCPEDKKRAIFIALIRLAQVEQENARRGVEHNTRLQMMPGTQAFEGDRRENRKLVEQFGKRPTLRAALRNATVLKPV
jgi:hypothetical protein